MIKLDVKNYIIAAITELDFKDLTEIQEKVIPLALAGKSVVGKSHTGTGKTHSFLIPIFEKLVNDGTLETVICSPTRELAEQIYNFAIQIASHSKERIDIRLYTGGTNRSKELEQLKLQPTIVIGTPGKLHDFICKENALIVKDVKTLIIDEADMALETGFLQDIDQMASRMPAELQFMVFSATIPKGLRPFLKKYMESPEFVIIDEDIINENIEHILINSRYRNKYSELKKVLKVTNPYIALIFTNTKKNAQDLVAKMKGDGYEVASIHGDLPVRVRKQVMKRINNNEYQYIVATDIAARGIDIDDVSHVINYELPNDVEFYVHRTGRTARKGNKGVAISFYEYESYDYLDLLEEKRIGFEFKKITDDELVNTKERNIRKKKVFISSEHEAAKRKVKKPTKVKPGYKKRNKQKIEKAAKRIARSKGKR